MKTLYVLVGVPASGKSWYVENKLLPQMKDAVYISTDKYVEQFAKEQGKTYSEVFDSVMSECVNMMANDVVKARKENKDIIWDQTSTSVASRKKKFKMLPDYKAIAVVFPTPDPVEHKKRLDSRPGKNIPQYVMESMIRNFEKPTLDEGFTEIWTISTMAGVQTMYIVN
jgi:predicted kinase